MAQESLDLFMSIRVIVDAGTRLKGESTDATFGSNPRKPTADGDADEPDFAIELNSFDLSFEEPGFKQPDDEKTDKAKPTQTNGTSSQKLAKTPQQSDADKISRLNEKIQSLKDQKKKFATGKLEVDRKFSVKKGLDTASPGLYLAYCEGMPKANERKKTEDKPPQFEEVAVMARKAGSGDKPFLVVTFRDVSVSAYSLSMDGPIPVESVSFQFGKVRIQYATQDATGVLGEYLVAEGDFRSPEELQRAKARGEQL